jgi:hypothetical protein
MHGALRVPFALQVNQGGRRHFGLFFSNFDSKKKVNVLAD